MTPSRGFGVGISDFEGVIMSWLFRRRICRVLSVIFLLLFSLTIVHCGGSSSDEETTQHTLTLKGGTS